MTAATTSEPVARVLDVLRDHGHEPRRAGSGWACRCPAHDDRSPSLSIDHGEDGRALLHCHAGCATEVIAGALRLSLAELMAGDDRAAPTRRNGPARPAPAHPVPARNGHAGAPGAGARSDTQTWPTAAEAVRALELRLGPRSDDWTYYEADGEPVGMVARWDRDDGKTIRPVSRRGDAWAIGAMSEPRPLYRLAELCDLPDGAWVYVTEGEKAADALDECGLLATTSAGGSNAARKTDWSPLFGRDVVVLPDHDPAGECYADAVVDLAYRAGAQSVRVVRLADHWPDLPAGGDAADLLDAEGGDTEAVRAGIEALVREAEPEAQPAPAASERAPEPAVALSLDDAYAPSIDTLGAYVESVAEAMQVPAEAVALLGMAIASGAVAGRVEVDCGGWREPAQLWALVLMPSGERKSALLAELTGPIAEWQRDEAHRLAPEVARREEERRIAEARLKMLRETAAKTGSDEHAAEAASAAEALDAMEDARPPRLLVSEATPEALAASMAEHGGRALVAAAEGDVLDVVLGRYSDRRANMGVYLSGHAGDAITQLRIGRESVSIDRPALALALIIQPAAAADMYESRAATGRGLVPRFLACAPDSKLGSREISPRPVDKSLRADAWTDPIRRMLDWSMPGDGEGPVVARFDPEGQAAFDRFRAELEPRLCPRTGDLGATDGVRAWASKLPGAIARLALVMACFEAAKDGADGPPKVVGADHVRAALAWAEWLIDARERAERVALRAGAGEDADATNDGLPPELRRLASWIRGRPDGATVREVAKSGPRQYRGDRARAERDLAALKEAGYASRVAASGGRTFRYRAMDSMAGAGEAGDTSGPVSP